MSRFDRDRLDDIAAAVEAIRSHLERGPLTDPLISDAVRIRLLEIGEADRGTPGAERNVVETMARADAMPVPQLTTTIAYTVGMASPASVRFDPGVARRLSRFVAAHPGLSASAATNLLVDEALRGQEHPLILFRDGPAGRRARLVGGPDVWEVARAVRSARAAEPGLDADALVELVSETTGVVPRLVHAAIDYWAAFPEEIDGWVERAITEATEAEQRWRREQALLGR